MRRIQAGVLVMSLVLFAVAAGAAMPAQTAAAVEQEIRDALLAEQRALVAGGCDSALGFFSDRQPLFVSNGRTMATKAAVRSSCVATTGGGAEPRRELQGHDVQVLSPAAGYSVTTYRTKGGTTQVVTKIWEKSEGGWRIAHSHISESGR